MSSTRHSVLYSLFNTLTDYLYNSKTKTDRKINYCIFKISVKSLLLQNKKSELSKNKQPIPKNMHKI